MRRKLTAEEEGEEEIELERGGQVPLVVWPALRQLDFTIAKCTLQTPSNTANSFRYCSVRLRILTIC